MSNSLTNVLAASLLIFVFIVAVFSIKDDSLTMDELAHLPAGYSYLTQRDMRLNPEHPPLLKDLSALPLLFIQNLKFPSDLEAWKDDVNGQWIFGNNFLFKVGNPADKMIFWGRLPMILLLVLLGFYVFKATREIFGSLYSSQVGNRAGLLALFLFSFSPTLLAHGRYVTTDVGAAVGAFIAVYYFLKFLKDSSGKNLIIAGIVLGFAQLLKFSLILLFPFFGILILIWAVAKSSNFQHFLVVFWLYLKKYILILILCFLIIGIFYQYHVFSYPPERQLRDAEFILASFGIRPLAETVVWLADKPILRAWGQYFFGILMILQRASGGNTGFFLGEISAAGWKSYFPVVYAIKEPLSFHILTIIALLYGAWLIKKPFFKEPLKRMLVWLKSHFWELAMLLFIGIYWTTSLTGNLNIGVRHLLPVFPFTILLVSGLISYWLRPPFLILKRIFLGLLILWQVYSVLSVYPYFLTYFNELAGGPDKGYLYVVDSNLDWGQDLKRLRKWTDQKGIDKIYVDYFGGSDTDYYLGDKNQRWWGDRNPKEMPRGSYLAVSATLLQGGRGKPAPGFKQPTGYYLWLDKYAPVKKIGNSIFVYYINQ